MEINVAVTIRQFFLFHFHYARLFEAPGHERVFSDELFFAAPNNMLFAKFRLVRN